MVDFGFDRHYQQGKQIDSFAVNDAWMVLTTAIQTSVQTNTVEEKLAAALACEQCAQSLRADAAAEGSIGDASRMFD